MRYHSWYNPEWQQIEMYAVSNAAQEIRFPSFNTSFRWEENDRILVEISRKFDPAAAATVTLFQSAFSPTLHRP
jgi:uncharacterized SAM-dependent methyltransferase